jgi:hypothetical protein
MLHLWAPYAKSAASRGIVQRKVKCLLNWLSGRDLRYGVEVYAMGTGRTLKSCGHLTSIDLVRLTCRALKVADLVRPSVSWRRLLTRYFGPIPLTDWPDTKPSILAWMGSQWRSLSIYCYMIEFLPVAFQPRCHTLDPLQRCQSLSGRP